MIFHIAKREEWLAAKSGEEYRTSSLKSEGFIHCSTIAQVIRVADFLFKGQNDLVLLEINDPQVTSEIKYEGETDELFPHIYGPINTSAVMNTHEFKPNAEGFFQLPEALETLFPAALVAWVPVNGVPKHPSVTA